MNITKSQKIQAVFLLIFAVGVGVAVFLKAYNDTPVDTKSEPQVKTQVVHIPHQSKVVPAPKERQVEELHVDESMRAHLDALEKLDDVKLKALIAQEQSKSRKANNEGKKAESTGGLPAGLGLPFTARPNVQASSGKTQGAPKPPIDLFSLSGLLVNGDHVTAYLAFDDTTPFLVKAGQTLQGVKIVDITEQGVRLSDGKRTRFLDGDL